jgi:chromosome segregation ATPase
MDAIQVVIESLFRSLRKELSVQEEAEVSAFGKDLKALCELCAVKLNKLRTRVSTVEAEDKRLEAQLMHFEGCIVALTKFYSADASRPIDLQSHKNRLEEELLSLVEGVEVLLEESYVQNSYLEQEIIQRDNEIAKLNQLIRKVHESAERERADLASSFEVQSRLRLNSLQAKEDIDLLEEVLRSYDADVLNLKRELVELESTIRTLQFELIG